MLALVLLLASSLAPEAWSLSEPGDVVGQLAVGYQGWFACEGDNSPTNLWIHWTDHLEIPSPGHQKFEIWPDTREYEVLYDTNYSSLGNGQPARLFSSSDDQTVETHFKWMQQYNIDVAALQRFAFTVKTDDTNRRQLNGVADKVRRYAEVYNRKFYIMWDLSSWNNYATEIEDDLDINLIGELDLLSSPAYAQQNGKPVVCIWGFGFDDRPGGIQALTVINMLKNRGFYVIGGVPTHWRTADDSKEGFMDAYLALDMLQPWAVGRMRTVEDAENYGEWLRDDFSLLSENNVDFQPVVYAGFAWSNWVEGSPKNEDPRQHGDFMWRQFLNLRQLGIPNVYVAMFDEYDEGTAIAKAAEDQSMIPTNQYFLTLDTDGVHVSSDFYLRLAGDGNRLVKGEIPETDEHPTPHIV